jgi:uncharacterized damage-inducible protein DinB
MFLDVIRRLYDYQREVIDHVLNVSAQLSNEEFVSSIVEGQPPIKDTLFHIIDVIETHFAWWSFGTERQAPGIVERLPQQFNDAKSIRTNRLTGVRRPTEMPYIQAFADDRDAHDTRTLPQRYENTLIAS